MGHFSAATHENIHSIMGIIMLYWLYLQGNDPSHWRRTEVRAYYGMGIYFS